MRNRCEHSVVPGDGCRGRAEKRNQSRPIERFWWEQALVVDDRCHQRPLNVVLANSLLPSPTRSEDSRPTLSITDGDQRRLPLIRTTTVIVKSTAHPISRQPVGTYPAPLPT
jgi:hypothetical protein